jgi:hypothetical protein
MLKRQEGVARSIEGLRRGQGEANGAHSAFRNACELVLHVRRGTDHNGVRVYCAGRAGEGAFAEWLMSGLRKTRYLGRDPLREAILLELNWAICARRAQGVSLDALGREYGLSKEALHLVVEHNDRTWRNTRLRPASNAFPTHDWSDSLTERRGRALN